MNLLKEPWMPVRKRDGSREWVDPSQLSQPDILAFDADRADFNGALAQFAIGLLQTTTPVERPSQWRALFKEPPSAEALAQWYGPVTAAFVFDGDGARFMQDPILATVDGERHCIAGLLLDSPSANALPLNKDFWVKRHERNVMCDHCAAIALFQMQMIAPQGGGGGGGKFVGIRGGGPLTTLMSANPRRSLWHDLWLNVMEQAAFSNLPGEEPNDSREATFPWLRDWGLSGGHRKELTPVELTPAHVLWATPRRMRIDFDKTVVGTCDVCHRTDVRLVEAYRDATGGLHYKRQSLWNHPHSPYRDTGDEGWQAVRQHSPVAYRDWLGIAATAGRNGRRRAKIVEHCLAGRYREIPGQLRVWAFGYDLDQGKPVAWYEAAVPLYSLADCNATAQERVQAEVSRWLDVATEVARSLHSAIKDAWFTKERAPKKIETRANFTAIDAAFWSSTEAHFYRQLGDLIGHAAAGSEVDAHAVNTAWLRHLQSRAVDLFDHQVVGTGPVEQQQPRRIALAYKKLKNDLYGPKLRESLGLSVDPSAARAHKAARGSKTQGGTK